tara:strand:- start:285 stop:524 length:240 start_codon:yes stop_codon:yes gene_type:complete
MRFCELTFFLHFELKHRVKNFCNLRDPSKASVLIPNKLVRTYEAKQSRASSTMMAEKSEQIENQRIFKKARSSLKKHVF